MENPPRSAIQRLPPLQVGTASWSLPLADHSAWELARVLVSDSTDGITSASADLMSFDPSFALWVACSARKGDGGTPRCVVDLARWFAARSLDVLRWPSDVVDESLPNRDRDMRPRWRELTADSLAVASLAADLADDDSVAAEAFLFGLLHNAADWLRGCGPKVSPSRQEVGCLPDWLAVLLSERAKGPRSEPVRLVMRAGTLWRDAGRRGLRVAGVDLSEVQTIRKRWRSVCPGQSIDSAVLPALVSKLRRLQGLEQRFSQILEHEKLDALGELAYGASHEINNPLANISARAQSMLRDESDPERRRTLAVINTQAFRANEMIADMMLFARPPEPVIDRVNLTSIVDDVIGELAGEAKLQGTRIERAEGTANEVFACVDGTQIAVTLRAICLNSLESLSAGGQVEVDVESSVTRVDESGAWVRISIRDTGPGITPEVRRHLFDPFFSGREAGRGMGLGLSKCWRIVTLHQGKIEVSSRLGEGTTFSIYLPVEDPPPQFDATGPAVP